MALLATGLRAQVFIVDSGTQTNRHVLITGTYMQDFDSLPMPEAKENGYPLLATWRNNETLPGWYCSRRAAAKDEKGKILPMLPYFYSYGSKGSTDRAPGFRTDMGKCPSAAIGVVFTNKSSKPITSITVAYAGEQWSSHEKTSPRVLNFAYKPLEKGFKADKFDLRVESRWFDRSSLDFLAPHTGRTELLDGNDRQNRKEFDTETINFHEPVMPGESFALGWFYQASTDMIGQGLAIDDIKVTFSTDNFDIWKVSGRKQRISVSQRFEANLPAMYPVINKYENGVATSIKIMNLNAFMYKDAERLGRVLRRHVDDLANFDGYSMKDFSLHGSQIKARELVIVAPENWAPDEKQKEIVATIIKEATNKNVRMEIVRMN